MVESVKPTDNKASIGYLFINISFFYGYLGFQSYNATIHFPTKIFSLLSN